MSSRIHFGALDGKVAPSASQSAVHGRTLDSLEDASSFNVSDASMRSQAEHQAILDDFERKKMAKSIAVPTEDRRVRAKLRAYGEPITLFAEGPGERRDRLRDLMTMRFQQYGDVDAGIVPDDSDLDDSDDSDDDDGARIVDEEFFHPGGDDLLDCRSWISRWSLPRASKRLVAQRAELEVNITSRKKTKLEWFTHLKTFSFSASQIGDDRPLSYCTFAPNSRLLATGSWSGLVKLWGIPNCEHLLTLKGHSERVSGIAFHPGSTLSQSSGSLNLVTSGMDGRVNMHNFESNLPIGELKGHQMRVARVAFHPSGRYIGTASFDQTWRLWDSERATELLLQEGHSREVFCIGFQGDGALVATAGMDAVGRVWDLRSGRSIMVLQGHVKPILALDWSPNSHVIATGSEDNAIRIWDVRQAKCTYTIPAHTNLVSHLKFWSAGDGFERNGVDEPWSLTSEPRFSGSSKKGGEDEMEEDDEDEDDEYHMDPAGRADEMEDGAGSLRRQLLTGGHLVSSSYDGTCKIFTEGDWKPLKSLAGLEGKVMSCDVSGDGKHIATASYDRTFKLFAPE
ncbi:U4/U6 small nuclear ribonucleoprotein Prp4 [Chytriomyces hyalinus]|nr:U4/U6 small nuclear ribonucleoprotein Prp4 [Chytriomyces hyalinus]